MSDAPRIRDNFVAANREEASTLKWDRSSPDVPDAQIEATFEVTGLPYARRAQYIIEIRRAIASLPGWGGGDY